MEKAPKPAPPVSEPAHARTEARKTLHPGDRGTRKLLKRHGDDLVCVRYRYDAAGQTRLTTVELVVDRAPLKRPRRLPPSAVVSVKAEAWEKPLHERLKKAGARWDPALRLWRMRYDTAFALGLGRRIQRTPARPGGGYR